MILWRHEAGCTRDRMRGAYCATMGRKRPSLSSNLVWIIRLGRGIISSSSSSSSRMTRDAICCDASKQRRFRPKLPNESALDPQGQISSNSIGVTIDHAAMIPLILLPQVLAARHTLIGCARRKEKRPKTQAAWTSGSMVSVTWTSTSCVQSQRIPQHYQLRFAYSPTSTQKRKS